MIKFLIVGSLIIFPGFLYGQVYNDINFALCSHPMKVIKIETDQNQSKFEISIENQIATGSFCADKNIDMQDAISKKSMHLIKSVGIPVCPDNYNFKSIGEVLTFQLFFPTPIASTKYVNIIENCDQYCFSIKGIILDSEMNKDINLGYEYYTKGKLDFALQSFKMAVEKNPDYPFGFLYFNIIQILAEKQDYQSAKNWYSKLKNSAFQDRDEVIARLKTQAFYLKII
jgi:tetratricopeptide (TPR) repeat protein